MRRQMSRRTMCQQGSCGRCFLWPRAGPSGRCCLAALLGVAIGASRAPLAALGLCRPRNPKSIDNHNLCPVLRMFVFPLARGSFRIPAAFGRTPVGRRTRVKLNKIVREHPNLWFCDEPRATVCRILGRHGSHFSVVFVDEHLIGACTTIVLQCRANPVPSPYGNHDHADIATRPASHPSKHDVVPHK